MMKRNTLLFIRLPTSILFLFGLNLIAGSVQIFLADVLDTLCGRSTEKEGWEYIILENRLPQILTAILCGASLLACGLMLRTAFRNPLASPDIFGVSSGVSLDVALVILLLGGTVPTSIFAASDFFTILTVTFVGAVIVVALILFLSTLVCNSVLLLMVSTMVGYISSSTVPLLNFFTSEGGVKSYMVRGMGNSGAVSVNHISLPFILCLTDIIASFLLVKLLNALLLGPQYVESLGVSTRQIRNILLVVAGLSTATTTAFCGPISFVGLVIPHITRLLFHTENHQILLSGIVLNDAVIVLLCNFIRYLPGEPGIIPLNTVTPLVGAPVIIYVIIQRR